MENANIDPLATDTAFAVTPPAESEPVAPPMEAPRLILAILGGVFAVVLGGLMLIDVVWSASGPVTVASPVPSPTNSAPAASG